MQQAIRFKLAKKIAFYPLFLAYWSTVLLDAVTGEKTKVLGFIARSILKRVDKLEAELNPMPGTPAFDKYKVK
jgi:hypothetical protein